MQLFSLQNTCTGDARVNGVHRQRRARIPAPINPVVPSIFMCIQPLICTATPHLPVVWKLMNGIAGHCDTLKQQVWNTQRLCQGPVSLLLCTHALFVFVAKHMRAITSPHADAWEVPADDQIVCHCYQPLSLCIMAPSLFHPLPLPLCTPQDKVRTHKNPGTHFDTTNHTPDHPQDHGTTVDHPDTDTRQITDSFRCNLLIHP